MVRIHATHAVFTYSKKKITDALEHLTVIKASCSTIKGLGRGKYGPMIPCHIHAFIKQTRKEKRFEITSERLCAERDAIALDTTQCDYKLLLTIEDVKALVEDGTKTYPKLKVLITFFATKATSLSFLQCYTCKRSFFRVASQDASTSKYP
jgi:hypothetical protein